MDSAVSEDVTIKESLLRLMNGHECRLCLFPFSSVSASDVGANGCSRWLFLDEMV